MTTLAILIVSWNARDDLMRCLTSLAASPPRVAHEIVVVDNASTDGAADLVARRFSNTHLIRSPENLGFARANNVGIRATESELILFLNPDTEVPPGTIDAVVDSLRLHPDAAAAAPRLVDADGVAELSFGPFPSPLGELRQKLLGTLHARGAPFARALVERLTGFERLVEWASGACLLCRRVDVEAVGLFDERYFLYWEDVDLCLAFRQAGRAVLFTPTGVVTHRRGRSSGSSGGRAREAYRRGQLAFYAKHQPRWLPVLRLYLRLAGQLPSPG